MAARLACLFLSLTLGACAARSALQSVPDALRGCWTERRSGATLTMRWAPDEHGWQGDLATVLPGESRMERYRLESASNRSGRRICPERRPTFGPACRDAVFSAEDRGFGRDGRYVLKTDAGSLTFAVGGESFLLVLFDGARDGCD